MKILFKLLPLFFISIKYVNSQGGFFLQALYLGEQENFNTTRDDCYWKRTNDPNDCPDSDINLILYTPANENRGKIVDIREADWLRSSGWDETKENVILIHGYAGGDNTLPMVVLRDAYLKHGNYNVFSADWGVLSPPPCYVAAVHNTKPVSKCLSQIFEFLRNSGLRVDRTTCVGHSLGAHICGLMSNHLNFRIERIIGLDPARPLIRPGAAHRLDVGDAKSVQVMHTNAGYYGEGGQIGHVDFCVNGGRRQPYCGNTINVNLCSHIWAICYLAQSIFDDSQIYSEPCTRRCPPGPIRRGARRDIGNIRNYIGNSIPMGQHTPMNAYGSYCVKDNQPPFCPKSKSSEGFGDSRCCIETF